MNERIIKMAIEAGFNPINCTGSNLPLFKKFAELIVKECIEIAYQNDVAKFTRDGYVIGQKIEKHFGVEW